jgi:hypothetical protein
MRCFFLQFPPVAPAGSIYKSDQAARRTEHFQIIFDPRAPPVTSHSAAFYKKPWTSLRMTSFVNAHIRKRKGRRARKQRADSLC